MCDLEAADHEVAATMSCILESLEAIREAARWADRQLDWERQECRRLRSELRDERRRAFAFTDDAIREALERAYTGEPVAATAVASELVDDPPHHLKIRTGFALSRLAAAGRAEKLPPLRGIEYAPHRWRPAVADAC